MNTGRAATLTLGFLLSFTNNEIILTDAAAPSYCSREPEGGYRFDFRCTNSCEYGSITDDNNEDVDNFFDSGAGMLLDDDRNNMSSNYDIALFYFGHQT